MLSNGVSIGLGILYLGYYRILLRFYNVAHPMPQTTLFGDGWTPHPTMVLFWGWIYYWVYHFLVIFVRGLSRGLTDKTEFDRIYQNIWLVVEPPLWKIWVRQLGWWHSPYMGSHQIHVPNHQPVYFHVKGNKPMNTIEDRDKSGTAFYRAQGLTIQKMACKRVTATHRDLLLVQACKNWYHGGCHSEVDKQI